MANRNGWGDALEATFVNLWEQGYQYKQISEVLGKSVASIRNYASRHRDRLGLEIRTGWENRPDNVMTELDHEWRGPVPFGHWLITKPWGTGNAQETCD